MGSTGRLRDWIQFDEQRRPEVEQHRLELLNRAFRPFVILGLVALGLGAWRALRDGQWGFAAAYLVLYLSCSVLAVSLKRLSVRARSLALLAGLFAIAVATLLRLGLAGPGLLVFVAVCGLTAILRGAKASLWAVAISVLFIAGAGFAFVHGHVEIAPGRLVTSLSGGSWMTTAVTFAVITIGLIIPFQMLSAKLAESLGGLEIKTLELERSNGRLRAEIERRERAEDALRASELRYRGIFDSTSVPIWEVELSEVRAGIEELLAEGIDDLRAHTEERPELVQQLARHVRIRDINNAALRIYGATTKEELLQSLGRITVPEMRETFREIMVCLAEGRSRFEAEAVNQTLQGERIHVILQAAIPEDPGANLLFSTVDITDRKVLERTLAHAQKMEAVGTLAGGIAHDFNNLLMGIRGLASLALRRIERHNPMYDHLQSIDELVDSGASLTGQLLGFARGGKYDVQTTDMAELLHRSLSMFGRAKKEIRIHEALDAGLWTVDVDRAQLEQVLVNLYVNAGHAMPDGGDLHVAAANVSLDAQAADAWGLPEGDYIEVTVRDTGAGMDEETRARVFEPFFTTRQLGRGSGLGLASAYGIVRNHDGALSVKSEPGLGATFVIHLRASKRPIAEPDDQPGPLAKGRETVLVVDDEQAVRRATSLMLKELGYHVLCAANGAEALQHLEQSRQGIDLVVLDMIMPEVSGPEVFAKLRAIAEDLPVVLSSGYSQDAKADALLQQGASGFLQKPFTLDALSRRVREILDAE